MTNIAQLLTLAALTSACGAAAVGGPSNATTTAPIAATRAAPAACPGEVRDIDSSRWIHDCNTPWTREYYQVFQLPDGAAYMLPRPDGTPPLDTLCKKAAGDVKSALDRYGWCDEVAAPSRVNAMKLDDALLIAHALHADMKFVATGDGIWPRQSGEDVDAVCKAPGVTGDLRAACIRLAPRMDDLLVIPTPSEAAAMAKALNKLYGIR